MSTTQITTEEATGTSRIGVYLAFLQLVFTLLWSTYVIFLPKLAGQAGIAPGTVKSKFKPFDCKSKVLYDANSIEVDALFQGNLPEPNPAAAAARLGFPKGDIPGVDVRCLKALHTFHFRDANTALINLDRVIYTFKRQ